MYSRPWKLNYFTFLKYNFLDLKCLKSAPGTLVNKTLDIMLKEHKIIVNKKKKKNMK